MIISNYIIVTIVDLLLLIHIMRHLSIHFELIIIIKPCALTRGTFRGQGLLPGFGS